MMVETVRRCLDCGGQMFEDQLDLLQERHQRSWTCWHCGRSHVEEALCYTDQELEDARLEQSHIKIGRPPKGLRFSLGHEDAGTRVDL